MYVYVNSTWDFFGIMWVNETGGTIYGNLELSFLTMTGPFQSMFL